MGIEGLLKLYGNSPAVAALGRALQDTSSCPVCIKGLPATSATAILFASLSKAYPEAVGKPLVFVLEDSEEAGYLYHDLSRLLGQEQALFFPSSMHRELRLGRVDAANQILRTEVLGHIVGGTKPLFVVTYPDALVERVVSQGQLAERTLKLKRRTSVERAYNERTMLDFGFSRVDYVYEPGQFAIRGEIVDVFSFSSEYPYRIVFFDNEIESIRTFDVRTQLSIDTLEEVTIVPRLSPAAASSESIFSFLPKGTVIVAKDLRFIEERAAQVIAEGYDVEEGEREGLPALVSGEEFKEGIEGLRFVSLGHSLPDTSTTISLDIAPQPLFHKNFELLGKTLGDYKAKGYRILILADSQKQQERLKSIFEAQDKSLSFTPVEGTLHAGFVDNALKVCAFTDHQIFDRFHRFTLRSERARLGKVSLTLKELQEFRVGDYVVHVDHGIGRFGGLVRLPEGGKMVEKIKIVYQNDDVVFVSIHALHKVSKYKGREGEQPRISRLGTGAWERMKERTKTKIKDIARDLIRLYAQRQKEKGFRFSPDGYLQNELEASFPYEDTPDQALAYQSVKADMESERPMDRLVCGDVGFGKTEVAIRAAFKACVDGKQVAVLVPTTVLAFQHYRTFTERLKGFPVRVDYLSRAKTPQETREVLRALADGSINIIVGTHKLIGKAVTFHDLGLLIIDEEQKFGVSTKERLRQLRTNVDTLTLTATPIPRTLQFSLMGARDLSVIQTPPPNRQPIETQLCLFSPETIAEAVGYELARGGQVFIVSNHISGLPALEEMVRRLVPYARIAVGHGQMPADELEQVVLRFCNYDYDVLISTTIIENGIDIPNANTIIVCEAQRFGLSDLHQMRGRVGRSSRKAFCYLLAPPLSSLSAEARRRLEAIESFSDLGSGINVAMQDLDIRGAGNMLGAEQSGFIADLGYETYQKILAEAVDELKGEEFADLYEGRQDEAEFVSECQIDSDIPMCFPSDYVPGSAERMLLYRELDAMRSEGEVEAFRQRMVDRFGPVPSEGEELMRVVALRRLGKRFGAQRIVLKEGRMRLYFVQNPRSAFFRGKAFGQLIAFATANARLCRLEERDLRRSLVIGSVPTVERAVALLSHIETLRPL
ncbi:MAG: transcription-repair coupling factor [Prevotellaceae bacterium]|nr:transcription-repair coupling factor [Prevotellaceae bacterium]